MSDRSPQLTRLLFAGLIAVASSTLWPWVLTWSQFDRLEVRWRDQTFECAGDDYGNCEPLLRRLGAVSPYIAAALDSSLVRAVHVGIVEGFGVRSWTVGIEISDQDGELHRVTAEIIEAGWPRKSMDAIRTYFVPFTKDSVGRAGWLELFKDPNFGGRQVGPAVPTPRLFSLANGIVLPTHPLWMGGLVNGVAFAFGYLVLVAGARAARSWRWRATGRCSGCGYVLVAQSRCPECGRTSG